MSVSSIKEHIAKTKDSINGKDNVAALLEEQFSSLEKSLHIMQLRLDKLMAQWMMCSSGYFFVSFWMNCTIM